jgi:PiT family inorganic phosphate transporter
MVGFAMAVFLMFALRRLLSKQIRKQVFEEPNKDEVPPFWIRAILITTCTLVSFFHGRNDGQKGIGLVMLILIGILPTYFAINKTIDFKTLKPELATISSQIALIDTTHASTAEKEKIAKVNSSIAFLNSVADSGKVEKANALDIRKALLTVSGTTKKLIEDEEIVLSENSKLILKNIATKEEKGIRRFTDHAPMWVILMISLSLGLGTMIGWKRIVVTVGEKIGKSHLTYAQGASAELVAATTIGLASFFKLPVSTTHALSSGIAGTMVASKGIKNLQAGTIKSILLAWVLTLPVAIILSASLFVFFRWLL